jgi:hypothetical protein
MTVGIKAARTGLLTTTYHPGIVASSVWGEPVFFFRRKGVKSQATEGVGDALIRVVPWTKKVKRAERVIELVTSSTGDEDWDVVYNIPDVPDDDRAWKILPPG